MEIELNFHCLGTVHNSWVWRRLWEFEEGGGGINFHPKHLGRAIKIQLVLCIEGHLKLTLIIDPV